MWRYGFACRFVLVFAALAVLAEGAVNPRPKLDLVLQYAQGPSVVLDVVYNSEGLRSTGLQFEIVCDAASRVTVAAGPAAGFANKTLVAVNRDRDHKRVLVFGLNSDFLLDGVIAVVTIAPGDTDAQDPLTVRLTSAIAVDQSVAPVTLEPAELAAPAMAAAKGVTLDKLSAYSALASPVYATMLCAPDVNGDGTVDVADLQLLAAMAVGDSYGRCDLNGDGKISVADFELVLNAIGAGGRLPPSRAPLLRGRQ